MSQGTAKRDKMVAPSILERIIFPERRKAYSDYLRERRQHRKELVNDSIRKYDEAIAIEKNGASPGEVEKAWQIATEARRKAKNALSG